MNSHVLQKFKLNRREFIQISAAATAAAAFPTRAVSARLSLPEPGPETSVALAGLGKGAGEEKLAEAIRAAAESATDFSWLSKGDSVYIKPVLNSGNEYPATTSPAGIAAMIALLKEKGAGRVVVGDTAGVEHVRLFPKKLTGSSRTLMEQSGMAQAAVTAGAELHFPEEEGWDAFFEDGPASGSHWKAGIMIPKILKEVDHVVLMPRCGRHMMAGSTLGLKAAVGYFRSDSRLELHHDAASFQEKIAEANTTLSIKDKQRLALTVATKTLATYGPDKGFVAEPQTGLIIASESVAAHDMVSLAWLLETRNLAPEPEKTGSHDPYNSQLFIGIANRVVVRWLGGMGAALSLERLSRNDINTIWDDRVLNRAFWLGNGIPRINLTDQTDSVPPEIKQNLTEMVSVQETGKEKA